MAKNPCKFKIKSTGEWVDAVTLKKRLNDGLLDEYVSSGVVKLKSFEAQQPKSDSGQIQEPVVESTPVIEEAQEQVESVTLPPSGNIKRPRTFERIDGEWKLKDGDGYTEVSDAIKQQVQMEYETQQRADQERMTEKAKREKGAVEEKIMKFLDGMKIDPNATRSTILPIPPKVWNGFIDVVKGFIEKGFTFSEAVTKAKREYFAPKVKEGELSKKDVDSAVTKFKNQYNTKVAKQVEAKQGEGTPIGKAIREAKSEMSDLEVEPAKAKSTKSTYGNRATIRKAIKAYDAGAKDATKKLQDIKSAVVEYIKENVDFKDSDTIKGQDSKVMINQVRSAKDVASLKKAFDLIDNVATRQYDRKKKRLLNDLKNLISRKNLISGKGPKKKGKISVDSQSELQDFIENILPTEEQLKSLPLSDIQDYYDMAQGIIEVGKFDVKKKRELTERKNRLIQGITFGDIARKDKKPLSTLDEIQEYVSKYGNAVVNGEFVTSVSGLAKVVKSDSDIEEAFGLPYVRGMEETSSVPWYKRVFISKNKLFIENQLKDLFKTKRLREMLDSMFSDGIAFAEIKNNDEVRSIKNEKKNRMNKIFGSGNKASSKLNNIPDGKPFRGENKGGTDVFTNDQLVMMYCHALTEGGREMLESKGNNINVDNVISHIESDPQLKEYADYLMNEFLPEMKEMVDPIYESIYDIKMPEGKYFPRYVDMDSLEGNYTMESILSADEHGTGSVIAGSLNQRVAKNPTLDLTKGATQIINNYVESMVYTKHFLPIAKNFDTIFNSKEGRKYIIDAIGKPRAEDLMLNMSASITGKNPYAAKNQNSILKFSTNVLAPVTAVIQIGGKLASIPKQAISIFNYVGAGMKYGIGITDVLAATVPTSKKEVDVMRSWVGKKSGYVEQRYRESKIDHIHDELDKTITKWSKSTGKAKADAYKYMTQLTDALIKVQMSPVMIGDFVSVAGGGTPFILAAYRKAISEGKSHEEAKDWAYSITAKETNLTQQSASKIATSNTQRQPAARFLLAYRSGQVAIVNKIIGSIKVLSKINTDIYSNKEKAQAIYDLSYYMAQSYAYNMIASGMLNYLLGEEDDEDKTGDYHYEVTMNTVQSFLQGYGISGALFDWLLNSYRGKDVFNNIPTAEFFKDLTVSTVNVHRGLKYGFDELTESEINKMLKTGGVKNIMTQTENLNQVMKGEKGFYDAVMNYDPENNPVEEGDHLYEMLFGEPTGASGSVGSGGGPSGEGGPDEGNPDDGGPDEGIVE